MRVAVALCALLAAAQRAAAGTAADDACRRKPCADPALAGRSVLFDGKARADARVRQTPQYVESHRRRRPRPDGGDRRRKPLEQRFADALLAPPPGAAAGMRSLDTTPCMSLQSTWNTFGSSFAPLTGCP